MKVKYFLTTNKELMKALKDSGVSEQVFTIKELSKALGITAVAASKRIRTKYVGEINEISSDRARELGKAPPPRSNSVKKIVNGESLSAQEVAIKYNIPLSTVRLWFRKDDLNMNVAMLTHASYMSTVHNRGSSASVWKHSAVSGVAETVSVSEVMNVLKPDMREEAAKIYNNSKVNEMKKLERFYNVLHNTFKYHLGETTVVRQFKLVFVGSTITPAATKELIQFIEPREIAVRADQCVYRMVRPIVLINGAVHFFTFEDFLQQLYDMTVGVGADGLPQAGSDPQGAAVLQNFSLNTSVFSSIVEHSLLGRANIQSMRKNLHGISKKHSYYVLFDSARPFHSNSCFFDALRMAMKSKGFDTKDLKTLANKKYPKGVKLEDIETVCAMLGVCVDVSMDFKGLTPPKPKRYGSLHECEEPFQLYFTYEPEPHFSALMGIRETLYPCEACDKYFQTMAEHRSHKQCLKSIEKSRKAQKRVMCYFDVETVNNLELLDVEVYSVVWKWEDQESPQFAINSKYTQNCDKRFVEDIQTRMEEENLEVVLVAYNGSSFDVWTVIKLLARFINFTTTIFKGGKFFDLRGKYCESKLRVWDPYLFLGMSLDNAAKSFGLETSKLPFSHEDMQRQYEANDRKFDFINVELQNTIREYNVRDVELLERICTIMFQTLPGCLEKCTVSSYAFSELKKSLSNPKLLDSCFLDEVYYKTARRAITGGRVQTVSPFTKFSNMDLSLIDVVSLYPSVMYYKSMPVGAFTKTREYVEGKHGIYCVNIKYQKEPVIIPLKITNRPLDWTHTGEIHEATITSVEIECMRKHFGKDCLEVLEGIYWEESSDQVFKPHIDKWMEVKKHQDTLKGKPEYNGCLREFAKKMLNTPYGKTIQNVFDRGFSVSTSANKTRKCIAKLKSDYSYTYVGDGLEIIEGELKEIDYSHAKPLHLGVFILAHSRCKMYDEVFSKTKVYYSDTDSALIDTKELNRLVAEGALKVGNSLGEYEVEMTNISEFWSIAPKCYALRSRDGKVKMRLKGVSQKSGWCVMHDNNIIVESGDVVDIRVFDALIKDHTCVRFFCSHFHHRKEDFALEYKKIEKII